jgi:hypothetical protein
LDGSLHSSQYQASIKESRSRETPQRDKAPSPGRCLCTASRRLTAHHPPTCNAVPWGFVALSATGMNYDSSPVRGRAECCLASIQRRTVRGKSRIQSRQHRAKALGANTYIAIQLCNSGRLFSRTCCLRVRIAKGGSPGENPPEQSQETRGPIPAVQSFGSPGPKGAGPVRPWLRPGDRVRKARKWLVRKPAERIGARGRNRRHLPHFLACTVWLAGHYSAPDHDR